jgi:hypothetical protein
MKSVGLRPPPKKKKKFWHELFKNLEVLPLQSQYILCIYIYILLFVVKNREMFISDSDVHNINTTDNSDLHLPIANLTVFKNRVLYFGIRICNQLPSTIKD